MIPLPKPNLPPTPFRGLFYFVGGLSFLGLTFNGINQHWIGIVIALFGLAYGLIGLYTNRELWWLFWIWALFQLPYSATHTLQNDVVVSTEVHWQVVMPISFPVSCSTRTEHDLSQIGLNLLPLILMYFWYRAVNKADQEELEQELDALRASYHPPSQSDGNNG